MAVGEVTFGYLLNGAAVQLYGDGYAALFRIQDGRIDSYTLRFRHYEGTGEQSLIMRELQAAAAMRAEELGGHGSWPSVTRTAAGRASAPAGWRADADFFHPQQKEGRVWSGPKSKI